jgi:hypothetical protein
MLPEVFELAAAETWAFVTDRVPTPANHKLAGGRRMYNKN